MERWERWLRDAEASSRTLESYKQVLTRISEQTNLTADPATVRPFLVDYRNKLQRRYENEEISRSTIRLHIAALKSFYRCLVEQSLYPENPMEGIQSIGGDRGLPRPLGKGAVGALFNAVDPSTPEGLRDLCLLWLCYHSLRNSEAATLKTSDIQFSQEEDSLVLRFYAKGKKERLVVLIDEAAEPLAKHLLQQYGPPHWKEWLVGERPWINAVAVLLEKHLEKRYLPVFLHNNRPLTKREFNRIFQRYREKAGLTDAVPHQLRHTCATNLLDNEVDIRVVQEILGHADIRQTQRYTQVSTGRRAKAMRRLSLPALREGAEP